ncbi:hypothetical protein TRIUR3_26104 [Triticum urartu]|uniref:Uncharacterized protein n=1 Tax=Triticum urartu TaxID=4572 RepID=M8A196_TRIUA|nr:hypothetical protein TRIUR3_26104 [Triticum urartu]
MGCKETVLRHVLSGARPDPAFLRRLAASAGLTGDHRRRDQVTSLHLHSPHPSHSFLPLTISLSPSHCSGAMAAPSFAGSRVACLRPRLWRDPSAPARIRILRSAVPPIRPPPSLPH